MSRDQKKEGRRHRQAETLAKKADAEAAFYRQCQSEAISASRSNPHNLRWGKSEAELFQKQGVRGINFDSYDKIDVVVKGPGMDAAEPMAQFSQLGSAIPPFLTRNVGLMGYESPTPIQKHSVPLALAGGDLMCCAQTGSGKT